MFGPSGVLTSTSSPSSLPIKALARANLCLAGLSLDLLQPLHDLIRNFLFCLLKNRVVLAPNFIGPLSLETSITSASDIIASNSFILPSMNDCFSLAEWYSAFSDKSPNSRASDIALIIFGLSSALSLRSSSSSLPYPFLLKEFFHLYFTLKKIITFYLFFYTFIQKKLYVI